MYKTLHHFTYYQFTSPFFKLSILSEFVICNLFAHNICYNMEVIFAPNQFI